MSAHRSVAVIGATGSTGGEACRILIEHPEFEIGGIVGRSEEPLDLIHPNLRGCGLKVINYHEFLRRPPPDAALLCTPPSLSMSVAAELLALGTTVVDLSGAFRFRRADSYQLAYGEAHKSAELLPAVYGLPEMDRSKLDGARLVANPGCYATAILLSIIPLVEEQLIDTSQTVQVFAVNGTTGADGSSPYMSHPKVSGSFVPYGQSGHRHVPEIEEKIFEHTGERVQIDMTTAHGNFARGLVVIVVVKPETVAKVDRDSFFAAYARRYGNGSDVEPFVRLVDHQCDYQLNEKDYGRYPQPGHVIGSNVCHIGVEVAQDKASAKLTSVIDNLCKGAAGNAIQVLNRLFDLPETSGLAAYGV